MVVLTGLACNDAKRWDGHRAAEHHKAAHLRAQSAVRNVSKLLARQIDYVCTYMTEGGLRFALNADHEAWAVAKQQDRHIETVAQVYEACRLIRRVSVDGPTQMHAVVCDDSNRTPLDANQCSHHGQAKERPQLLESKAVPRKRSVNHKQLEDCWCSYEDRICVGHVANERTDIIDAQTVLRDGIAQ